MQSVDMRNKRAKVVANAREFWDVVTKNGREPNAEERAQFDAMMTDAEQTAVDIQRVEQLEAEERILSESRGRATESAHPGRRPDGVYSGGFFEAKNGPRGTAEYRSGFDNYLL